MNRPLAAAVLILAACSGASPTMSPSAGPSAGPSVTATTAGPPSATALATATTVATATPTPVATAPPIEGEDLGVDLVGTYFDEGEPSVGWHFLAAGDAFCLEIVRTNQSCLKITRTQFGDTPVDYGPLTVAEAELRLLLLFDEDGACLGSVMAIPFVAGPDRLELNTTGTCIRGAPRGALIPGEPH